MVSLLIAGTTFGVMYGWVHHGWLAAVMLGFVGFTAVRLAASLFCFCKSSPADSEAIGPVLPAGTRLFFYRHGKCGTTKRKTGA